MAALIAWSLTLDSVATAPLALAAGIATALRQCRWRSRRIGREPILLAMPPGHAWLALGLVLLGVVGVPPPSIALHALGVGAVGTMILAVMCRTSLAHTGRPAVGGAGNATACLSLTLAAGLRVTAELVPAFYLPLVVAAGASWIAGLTIFVLIYAPVLGIARATRR